MKQKEMQVLLKTNIGVCPKKIKYKIHPWSA